MSEFQSLTMLLLMGIGFGWLINKVINNIKKAVADTVWHEIAHHFGMTEHQVRQAERNR